MAKVVKNKNGQTYSKHTIKAYAQVLAIILRCNSFSDISVENLYEISDASVLESLEKQIKRSPKFSKLSKNTRDLFGPAMKKYAEFLRWRERN